MKGMRQSKLFPCYSIPMRDYFMSKGIRYCLKNIIIQKSSETAVVYMVTYIPKLFCSPIK